MYWYLFRFRQRYYFTGVNPYNFEELDLDTTTYLNQQICAGRYSGTFKHEEYRRWTYNLEAANFSSTGPLYDLKIYNQRK